MFLVVAIPAMLAGYGWWMISSFQRLLNIEVQERAVLIHDTLGVSLQDSLDHEDLLLSRLMRLEKSIGEDVLDYTLLRRTGDNRFEPVAGFSGEHIFDSVFTQTQYSLAWGRHQAIASAARETRTHERVLLVTKPILSASGQPWGLANIALSLTLHDELVSRTVSRFVIAMLIAVLLVLLLLGNHVRIFGYASALHKHEAKDKIKDDFISVASHELRTPITGIRSFLSLMMEGKFGSLTDEGKSFLREAFAQTSRLTNLVSDMLDVSRIEQGRMEFTIVSLDPRDVIRDVVTSLSYRAQEKGIALDVVSELNEHVLIRADRTHLQRILTNLIGNAVKYTSKGNVHIILRKSGSKHITILVQDTGIGIPPDKIEMLFQKFSRVHSDETRKVQGTGLGLWITKALTEKMDGKIYVASMYRRGSEFSVVFPNSA